MNVLVDTSVWSLALRRPLREIGAEAKELANLVEEGRVTLIGAIRQELLSGIKSQPQFEKLRDHLRAFPDVDILSEDHEKAAALFNQCRAAGIQGSNTDFLICAVAARHSFAIFTTDEDFVHFARVLPITLYEQRR